VDVSAIRHNIGVLRRLVEPAALCAVVKADAYGHGATAVGAAAIEGGAAGLAVALVDEGVELRESKITAPILVLSDLPPGGAAKAVAGGLTPTLSSVEGVEEMVTAARALGTSHSVHVKLDTGMHRMGADPQQFFDVVAAVMSARELRLEGVWTHLAVADGGTDEDRAFTDLQLAVAWPRSRYDLVRCGLGIYGELPLGAVSSIFGADPGTVPLRPALSIKAQVVSTRTLDAGERPSYGRLRPLAERSLVATVPLGYADGLPRAMFGSGYEVLIGGRRRPLAGMVTMDQIIVDCGPDSTVSVGDEVVLLGSQGDEAITADEWADRLGTISWEVLCGIGPRVPRRLVGGSGPAKWKSARVGSV
jgi:alanine racemase